MYEVDFSTMLGGAGCTCKNFNRDVRVTFVDLTFSHVLFWGLVGDVVIFTF